MAGKDATERMAAASVTPTTAGTITGDVALGASPKHWLWSRRADFWFACAGGSLWLLVLLAILYFRGWRELDAADFLLAELHLGATFDAVVRRRLWRAMPWDVVVIPLLIIGATYGLMLSGSAILVSTVLAYLSVWHRGRQNLGLGRWYQKAAGGPVSKTHNALFHAALYLPMLASVLFYTSAYPQHYEGQPYHALIAPPVVTWGLGAVALAAVLAYFVATIGERRVHPAERWLVLAHAVAFGSAYLLGAWNLSFIIVIAIHHEIQYLFFTYAVARKQAAPDSIANEARLFGSFAVWPLLGLAVTLTVQALGISEMPWVVPSFVGLLLVHYWLDGRIWTRRAATARAS
jgi:hypothetical protein